MTDEKETTVVAGDWTTVVAGDGTIVVAGDEITVVVDCAFENGL